MEAGIKPENISPAAVEPQSEEHLNHEVAKNLIPEVSHPVQIEQSLELKPLPAPPTKPVVEEKENNPLTSANVTILHGSRLHETQQPKLQDSVPPPAPVLKEIDNSAPIPKQKKGFGCSPCSIL